MMFLIGVVGGTWLLMEAVGGTSLETIEGKLERIKAGETRPRVNRRP